MVRFLSITLLLLITLPLLSQRNCDSFFFPCWLDPPIFDKTSNSAQSDLKKLSDFIAANLTYSQKAKEDKIEGTVVITFWVDTIGNTSEHKISEGVREDLDNEALRVAKLIKFDVPAKNVYGNSVGFCLSVPIRFLLNEEKCKQTKNQKIKK
jgi:TonB family protein